jgi:hypothetical protein
MVFLWIQTDGIDPATGKVIKVDTDGVPELLLMIKQ